MEVLFGVSPAQSAPIPFRTTGLGRAEPAEARLSDMDQSAPDTGVPRSARLGPTGLAGSPTSLSARGRRLDPAKPRPTALASHVRPSAANASSLRGGADEPARRVRVISNSGSKARNTMAHPSPHRPQPSTPNRPAVSCNGGAVGFERRFSAGRFRQAVPAATAGRGLGSSALGVIRRAV